MGVNASWGLLNQLWADGLASMFGTNIFAVGAFFAIFTLYITTRMGLGLEIAFPFVGAILFLMAGLNPGLLPTWLWTVFLLLTGFFIYRAYRSAIGGV